MDGKQMPVVLIPSLEPDDRLPAYVEELMASGFDRVVVVDDGSGPDYQPVFGRLSDLGAQVLSYPVNKGKGGALKTGLKWIQEHMPDCGGVVTADADGQHKVADCLRLAEAMAGGEDALWLGSRDFNLPDIPPKSRFGNKTTSLVFKALYGVWLPDTQTGLRGFSAAEIPFMAEVEGDRYEYEMNVLIACARRKLPMKTLTIETVYENNNEGSHFHPLRDSWRIYKVILGNFFKFMGSSLFCVLIDQLAAGALRNWVLPPLGLPNDGGMWNLQVSGWVARVISATVNFLINKNLVFGKKGKAGPALWRYILLSVAVITASNAGVWLLGKAGMAPWLAKVIMDTLLYFVNYRVQQNWVFADKEEAA
ncbi:MAG: bifunctional glycosyltransferase family 2/GtrA family protein [Clostridia bacterium]|nr:bifunctional glycosyltransferase family 2/GtrA family protein [Clostridia bacterium]